MKNLASFFVVLFSISVSAQQVQLKQLVEVEIQSNKKQKFLNSKAPTDTLYYQDFAGGIPAGWSVGNTSGSSNNWIWSTSAPGGQYSTSTTAINSTSASNGFVSLPADLYNTPLIMPLGMDAYFQSGPIPINPKASIDLRWQQSSRYCCGTADELVVEISTDNSTWVTYDAINGRGANTAVPATTSSAAEQMRINVSAVLANEDTAYVRFRMTGATHYYWMIDDFVISEGYGDVMELEDFEISFFNNFNINPPFYMVPRHLMDSMNFTFYTKNEGSNTQTGVRGHVTLSHDSLPNGQAGVGVVGSVTNYLGIPVPYLQIDTFNVGPYVYQNTPTGYYKASLNVVTNTASQLPSWGQGEYQFEVTDSVMSRAGHESGYVGDVGAAYYGSGGGNDGDRWASLFSTGNSPSVLNSVSMYVADVATNNGVTIRAQVWNWDDTAATIARAISPLLVVSDSLYIDSTLRGTWIILPLQNQLVLSPNSQILVGWEQVSGAIIGGAEFSLGRDRELESYQPPVSSFVYINDAAPAWGWVTQLAAIRLNFVLPVGVQESIATKLEFSVFPNPSTGQFALRFKTEKLKRFTLKVRNNLGQTVLNEELSVNGSFAKSIDLSGYESGVYFLSLENESERFVEKIVVQ